MKFADPIKLWWWELQKSLKAPLPYHIANRIEGQGPLSERINQVADMRGIMWMAMQASIENVDWKYRELYPEGPPLKEDEPPKQREFPRRRSK